jgi:glycosyltransferase involved in cell wall biosynthesis
VALLLLFLPVCKLIIHERGTAWNQPIRFGFVTRFNANKAKIILSNSRATKSMLVKKFSIPEEKITVIHNGVDLSKINKMNVKKKDTRIFTVGYIGRIDSPKGIHVLVNAIQRLSKHNIELLVAGDGPLLEALKNQSKHDANIVFLGRVQNSYNFLNKIDLLVVPSIREPLGNVCLEAGLCKTPVLASNIDGIPEIIRHGVSGELITPTEDLTVESTPDMAPIPEYVVSPKTQSLLPPMQLNDIVLADKILELSRNIKTLNEYGLELHHTVVNHFSLEKYSNLLEGVYEDINSSKN